MRNVTEPDDELPSWAVIPTNEEAAVTARLAGAQEQSWRIRAYHQGIGNISDKNVAEALLNLAKRNEITMSYGIVGILVEAAARVDGDAYLAWIKRLDDAQAETSVPCLTFS